ncbi:MAG: 30S ribosomal protein S13 [Verrucomicrobia bacterium CG_4_10_14_3_um_filter_43_23]|nr:MAG: 30S ribosomal protein S13 [Verrucomicrobia bacterium CG1_02_43_26]PIP59595.1 MAG: 30S ribosomal protein S13 [Verrucomicrobia bacterium CG22_combo_CG10-13_8_21_14_all_43_17]PIX58894.1 MAG: 30S ribosomal protein S13 [Verrucomicrobia bacterium CG_4_10_14_3_um_filter_43_23]PIY61670.1 MAG: 30S ribosomal protein S13 [Verrucomicrobia bacterium CG_4_10_14_0_8_um_filter_43_34]PJA44554.1 MAG: 30S ribosomal protein S13 [Verrucomicrobia bacterium CG_4_9_14_3_um_filter_43_20]
MPRLLGVDIPEKKKIEYSLRYLYGIGPNRSVIVLEHAGIDPNVRANQLSEEELNKIAEAITELGYEVEGDLRRHIIANIKRLQAIKAYRGIRHYKKLPVRGQRTSTNARTAKGKRRMAVTGKKKADKK